MSPLRGTRSMLGRRLVEVVGSPGVYQAAGRKTLNFNGRDVSKAELQGIVRNFASVKKGGRTPVVQQEQALIAARTRERNLRLAELS